MQETAAFASCSGTQPKLGAPYAYQTIEGRVSAVEASYILDGQTVRFHLGDHDSGYPVVIDPDIVFATYIGATQPNWGFTAAYDADGRAIGGTALWDGELGTYPTTAGAISTAMDINSAPFDWRDGVQPGRHRPNTARCSVSTSTFRQAS